MNMLYDRVRAKNRDGLPLGEAVQLFLWLYSTTDILPLELRKIPIDKKLLVETFQRLSEEGFFMHESQVGTDRAQEAASWRHLIDDLLSKTLDLDPDFPARATRYL